MIDDVLQLDCFSFAVIRSREIIWTIKQFMNTLLLLSSSLLGVILTPGSDVIIHGEVFPLNSRVGASVSNPNGSGELQLRIFRPDHFVSNHFGSAKVKRTRPGRGWIIEICRCKIKLKYWNENRTCWNAHTERELDPTSQAFITLGWNQWAFFFNFL